MAKASVHSSTSDASQSTHDEYPVHVDQDRIAAHDLSILVAVPNLLAALVRLNIFEALAQAGEGAPLTAHELAQVAMTGSRTVNVSFLERALRTLTTHKVFREIVRTRVDDGTVERRYALAPIGKFFVENERTGDFANVLLCIHDPSFLRPWDYVHESILDGGLYPFPRAHGGLNVWQYFEQNPPSDNVFQKAMSGMARLYVHAILEVYRGFDDVNVLVDVGGNVGTALSLITARYPHIKGINFDQPCVIATCPNLPGVEFVGGDMFESIPSGDAVFMKFVLHDWDDEHCIKLLRNCCKALPRQGKVITADLRLPENIDLDGAPVNHMASRFDVIQLLFCETGARERTFEELRTLGLAAGFAQVVTVCQVDALAVVEMLKA